MEPSLTIDEFCRKEKISRSTFYDLEKIGIDREVLSLKDAGAPSFLIE